MKRGLPMYCSVQADPLRSRVYRYGVVRRRASYPIKLIYDPSRSHRPLTHLIACVFTRLSHHWTARSTA